MNAVFSIFDNDVVALAVLLLGGFFGGKLVNRIKMPAVAGYLLAGILLGHFGLIHSDHLEQYRFIEVLGLSIVALIIGGGMQLDRLRAIGRSVVVITLVQVAGAFLAVLLTLRFILSASWEISILLGAIASATAPASPVVVISELRAKGPLTETLLAVVGMDDAACLMIFGVASAIVNILIKGSNDLSLFLVPIWEILGSMLIGGLIGFVILRLIKHNRNRHEIVIILIGITFLTGELGEYIGLSALLLNMSSGIVIANFNPRGSIFHVLEDIELPVFIIFFTLAGASLNLKLLLNYFGLTMAYILSRAVGKVGGAFLGAKVSTAEVVVKKYLGFAMLSQAGVAIALVLAVQSRFPQYGSLINAIILAAVTVNELIGPLGTKYALTSSGEAGKDHRRRGVMPSSH